MKPIAIIFTLLVAFAQASYASNPNPQKPVTLPSGPTAIPLDVAGKMDRQEQRLDQIDTRLAVIEKSVASMETDVKELVRTDTILGFLIGMLKLFIPGLGIGAFCVWLGIHLNERLKGQKPQRDAAGQ